MNTNYASVNDNVTVSSWYYAKLISIYESCAPIGEKIPVKLVITSDKKADSAPDKYFSNPVGFPSPISPSTIFGITSDSELSSEKIGITADSNTIYLTVPNKTSTTVKTKVFNKDVSLTINTTDKNYFNFLNNLIQQSLGSKIDLNRDNMYFEPTGTAFKNGILVGVDSEGDYNTITIDGHGHTIEGMGLSRVFIVDSYCPLILKNINFVNIPGYAILAMYSMNPFYLTVENCTFTNINGGPAFTPKDIQKSLTVPSLTIPPRLTVVQFPLRKEQFLQVV